MPEGSQIVLLAMTLLLVKHCIADFYLQTPFQFMNKGRYGHPGGLLHAGIHLVFSLPLLAVIAPESWQAAAVVLGGEFLIHYHVDWTKEQVTRRAGWTPQQNAFWRALGLDQLAHGLTYVAMVWALLTPGLYPWLAAEVERLPTLFR